MKVLIKKLLRETIEPLCVLEYESDRIRLDEIKSALNDDLWDDDETYSVDDLYQTDWLSKALNKENYVDYYELFVKACWDGMFQKPEYKGLDKKSAVEKLINERFSKIAKLLNLSIIDWNFKFNVLNIKFGKGINEQMIDGQNMNNGTQTACNQMSVATYAEGIKLIVAAIGRPEENPEMWKRISKPLKNWKKADKGISGEVKSGGMSGDSLVDESNTYWTMVQSTICEQGGNFQ